MQVPFPRLLMMKGKEHLALTSLINKHHDSGRGILDSLHANDYNSNAKIKQEVTKRSNKV